MPSRESRTFSPGWRRHLMLITSGWLSRNSPRGRLYPPLPSKALISILMRSVPPLCDAWVWARRGRAGRPPQRRGTRHDRCARRQYTKHRTPDIGAIVCLARGDVSIGALWTFLAPGAMRRASASNEWYRFHDSGHGIETRRSARASDGCSRWRSRQTTPRRVGLLPSARLANLELIDKTGVVSRIRSFTRRRGLYGFPLPTSISVGCSPVASRLGRWPWRLRRRLPAAGPVASIAR